jgi:hypothetical protein
MHLVEHLQQVLLLALRLVHMGYSNQYAGCSTPQYTMLCVDSNVYVDTYGDSPL